MVMLSVREFGSQGQPVTAIKMCILGEEPKTEDSLYFRGETFEEIETCTSELKGSSLFS